MIERDEIEDRAYYAKRAREELVRAATCEDNAAARAHLDLAALHRKRASGTEPGGDGASA